MRSKKFSMLGAFSALLALYSFPLSGQESGFSNLGAPDVLGIRLGMSAAEITALAERDLSHYSVSISTRNHPNSNETYVSRMELDSGPSSIIILFTGAFSGNLAYALVRDDDYRGDNYSTVPLQSTLGAILQKYGLPTFSTGGVGLDYIYNPGRMQIVSDADAAELLPHGAVFSYAQLARPDNPFQLVSQLNSCAINGDHVRNNRINPPQTNFCSAALSIILRGIRDDTISGLIISMVDYTLFTSSQQIDRDLDLVTNQPAAPTGKSPEL